MNKHSSCLQRLKTPALTASSAGSEPRVLSANGNRGKVSESSSSNATKVKRWKTKKERNNAKFKSHKETFQKKAYPRGFLERCHINSCSSCSQMACKPAVKDICNLKQVFITHSRLTQHQGIFNREIKSVNVGRLVKQTTEIETDKTDVGSVTIQSEIKSPQSQINLSLGRIPILETRDQETLTSLSQSASDILVRGHKPVANTELREEEDVSEMRLQGDDDHLHITPLSSGTRTSPCRNQMVPVLEAVEDILNMLSSCSLFPGRNLVSETRQSIAEKVKQLCGIHPNLSPVSVQREMDCSRKVKDAHKLKDPGWKDESGRDARKCVQRPQSSRQQMQTSSSYFLSLPSDSPVHTLIKMVTPENHQKITDDHHQPVNSGSGNKPSHRCQPTAAEDSRNLFTITSINIPKMSKEKGNTSSFCRARRPNKMDNTSLDADRPPSVRWKLEHDDLETSLSHTCNVHQHFHNPKVTEHECVTRQPLREVPSDQLNKTSLRTTGCSSGEKLDVLPNIWNCTAQKSPSTKIFDCPPDTRLCYRELIPHRTHSENNFGSHHNIFPEMLETRTLAAPENFQFVDAWNLRNVERQRSPLLGTGTYYPHGIFPHQNYNLWRPPSSLREEPVHKVSIEHDPGVAWNGHEDWAYGTSYLEQPNHSWETSRMMAPYSESQYLQLDNGRSLSKELMDSAGSDWVYPRMKFY
ncbi:uncharacterized protein LOC134965935 [Pseudophryne corroboree]|uniref:uncharacterized protein LOC134965935 n=1 Tax=Pseudophryne corroboree TaxID=495146 RepID=UPI0030815611